MFAEVPANDERFSLILMPSRPARLWIDLFTYSAIDDASDAYLFIRNSESGRRTLFSSAHVGDMADRITSYMAREIVRRERQEAALLEPYRQEEQAEARPSPAGFGARGRHLGLRHRPHHRRRGPFRRGVAQRSVSVRFPDGQASLNTRRSHSQTCDAVSATARPTISQRQPPSTLPMRYSL